MAYNPEKHHRKSIRLKEYDYSQNGAYFITICTQDKKCLFGEIIEGKMILNEYGEITHDELQKTTEIRENMEINCFVVMPNHIHAIVVIDNPNDTNVGAYCNTPLPRTFESPSNDIGSMVRGYKSTVTTQINKLRNIPKVPVWQRNYHEHIIRNEQSFEHIHNYIIHNPEKWEDDCFYVNL